ncbi:hypothetical protein GCM10023149_53020 [Mucilaginibacter gynuensis]|uniref:M23ase beta-sheet core domain-containing protein n=1 Tax=Mucilaginibacter gynuensis TaxID=1302236 RepID=A0ABP8HLM2_9SPHI
MVWCACSDRGAIGIFKKQSPHEAYAQKLKDAGLDKTVMGSLWLNNATQIVDKALNISLPYKETGYFAADKPDGAALRFEAKRGRRITVNLVKKPSVNYSIYIDLFQQKDNETSKIIASADTGGIQLQYDIKQDGKYILRLQPELLQSGEYTLTITAGPSLSMPVSASGKPYIGSLFGANRDDGSRKHEGIDIFAPKGTAAIAAANGTVTNVGENTLGGLVVFFRPDDADYTLYYAHLDKQLVQQGQRLKTGDTVGLVGNTGNAQFTPSHLHFGVYGNNGVVNPVYFVEKETGTPAAITGSLTNLNATVRTINALNKLYAGTDNKQPTRLNIPKNTALTVEAATGSWYKVKLPDGVNGYIANDNVAKITTIRNITLKNERALYDAPDSLNAPRKTLLATGKKVEVLAAYKNYYLVKNDALTGWILAAE